MKTMIRISILVFGVLILAGCSSTKGCKCSTPAASAVAPAAVVASTPAVAAPAAAAPAQESEMTNIPRAVRK